METVYVDRAGTLWAGTYAGGVNYAHAQNALFNYYDPRRGDHLPGVLSAIVAEPSGDVLWIGSDAGGILRFDVRSGEFAYYPCTTVPGEMFKDNNVKSLLLDGKTLYVGLYTGLLYTFDTAACRWTGMWRNPDHSAIYSLARHARHVAAGDLLGARTEIPRPRRHRGPRPDVGRRPHGQHQPDFGPLPFGRRALDRNPQPRPLPLPALRRTDPLHLRRREFHLGKPHHGDLRRQPQTHPDRHLGRGTEWSSTPKPNGSRSSPTTKGCTTTRSARRSKTAKAASG